MRLHWLTVRPHVRSYYVVGSACQECPLGAMCPETRMCLFHVKRNISQACTVKGNWTINVGTEQGRLVNCPTGHYVFNGGGDVTKQECLLCNKGQECLSEECTTCTLCGAGTYKDFVGADACKPCAANKYRTATGGTTQGQAESDCVFAPHVYSCSLCCA